MDLALQIALGVVLAVVTLWVLSLLLGLAFALLSVVWSVGVILLILTVPALVVYLVFGTESGREIAVIAAGVAFAVFFPFEMRPWLKRQCDRLMQDRFRRAGDRLQRQIGKRFSVDARGDRVEIRSTEGSADPLLIIRLDGPFYTLQEQTCADARAYRHGRDVFAAARDALLRLEPSGNK